MLGTPAMKPMTKAGVLALIALMQVAVIGGVLAAYRQLSATFPVAVGV
jgi:hypothetical protein